jgi:hypothetical protein
VILELKALTILIAALLNLDKAPEAVTEVTPEKNEITAMDTEKVGEPMTTTPLLSEKRKALFEPLEPITNLNGKRPTAADSLLPPPDFETANYPKGWLIGKKRKLVNVDVVESMRRIAVQEMNRKVKQTKHDADFCWSLIYGLWDCDRIER